MIQILINLGQGIVLPLSYFFTFATTPIAGYGSLEFLGVFGSAISTIFGALSGFAQLLGIDIGSLTLLDIITSVGFWIAIMLVWILTQFKRGLNPLAG